MLRLTRVLGNASEPRLAEELHRLEHHGVVDVVSLDAADTARRRLRISSERGVDCAILLSRSDRLSHGAVLLLEPERAVVVRVTTAPWLRAEARDRSTLLELGYLAGNLHWKVRFEGDVLWVAVDGDPAPYRARLQHLLASGRVSMTEGMPPPASPSDVPGHSHAHEALHAHENLHSHEAGR